MWTHTVRLRRNAALKSSIASLCSFSFIISTSKCSHYIKDQLNSQREGGHWLTEQGPMGTLSFYIHINSWAGVTKILLLTAHLFFSYLKHFWCFHTKPLVQNWVRLTFDMRESAWKGTWVSTDDVNSIFLCIMRGSHNCLPCQWNYLWRAQTEIFVCSAQTDELKYLCMRVKFSWYIQRDKHFNKMLKLRILLTHCYLATVNCFH